MDFDQDKKIIAKHGSIVKSRNMDRPRYIRPVERQRMRPWLIEHLDKNDITGLVWQARRDKVFRISWKHAANQCFNLQKDTNLFERWAIHTGRHQDSDHKRWKANFRCALNSLPDVIELKEQGIKKGNNAFKVYRFLDDRETKANKEGKPRKKKEKLDYDYENELKLTEEYYEQSYTEEEAGTSAEDHQDFFNMQTSHLPNLRQIYSTNTFGVDLLIEADNKEKLEPINNMDNLQEILAAATASLAAGGDALALEKISIEQLSLLGEVSKMKLDIRQNDLKGETSGLQYVFLCKWCEKVFHAKVDLFQHFLVVHQDKLLSGEEYGTARTSSACPPVQSLEKEIADLEQKVLNFTRETFQPSSGEVIEDGEVVDQVTNSQSSVPSFVDDQALDLTVGNIESIVPKEDEALDLSINSSRQDLEKTVLFQKLSNKIKPKPAQPKSVNKLQSNVDADYMGKFGNYGLAGAPRTKRQMSLLLKKKEEEKIKKSADAAKQHSKEDFVHAEILISLKCAAGEENDNDTKEDNYEGAGGSDIDEKGDNKNFTDKKHGRKIFYVVTESEKEGKDADVILIDTANIDVKDENRIETKGLDDVSKGNINEKFISDADSKRNILDRSNVAKLKQVALLTQDGSYVESHALQNDITDMPEDEELNSCGKNNTLKGKVDCLEDECCQKNVEELNLKAYKCGICLKMFSIDKELFQHVLTHKTGFLCKICGKMFEQLEKFQIHMRHHASHDIPLELKCSVCRKNFSNKTESESHKCDLIEIVHVKTDNFTKTCEQVLVEEKGHEEKQNLEYNERNKRAIVKEDINEEVHEVAEGNIALSTTAMNSLAGDNLASKQNKMQICVGKDTRYIEPTAICNILDENSVIAEKDENHFGLVLPYQGAQKRAERKDNMFATIDDHHEYVRLQDDESASSVLEMGQSVMYSNGQNNEAGIIEVIVQQTGEKSKDKIETSYGQADGQNTNNIEVITTKLYQALAEAGKKSQEVCHIPTVSEIVKDVDKFLIKSEKLEKDNKNDIKDNKKDNKDIKDFEKQIKQLSEIVATSNVNRLGIIVYGICGDRQRTSDKIQTHLQEGIELKNEELPESSKECVICNTSVGIEELNNHLKSHSVYELSQTHNLHESQNLEDGKKKNSAKELESFKIKLFVCSLCNLHFESIQALKEHVMDHNASSKVVEPDKCAMPKQGIKRKSAAPMQDNVAKRRGKNIESDTIETSMIINQKEEFETNKIRHDFGENVIECQVKTMEVERKNVSMLAAALQSAPKFSVVGLTQSGNQKTGVLGQVLGQPMKSVRQESTNFRPLLKEPWWADMEQNIIDVAPKLKQINVKKTADTNMYIRNEEQKNGKKKSVDQNLSVQDVSEAQYVSQESISQNASSQPSESTSTVMLSVSSAVSKLSSAPSVPIAAASNKQNALISVAESNKLASNSGVSYSMGVLPDGVSAILLKSADQSLLKDLSFRMPERGGGVGKSVTLKIPVCVTADLQASGKLVSLAQSSLASKSDIIGSKIIPAAVPINIGMVKRSVTNEAKGTLTQPRGLVTVVGIENNARVPNPVIVGTDTPSTVTNDVKVQIGKSLLAMVQPESIPGTSVQSSLMGTQKIVVNSNVLHLDQKSSAVSVSSQQMLPHVQMIPIDALLKSLPVTSKTDVGKRTLTTPVTVNLLSSVTSHAQGNSPYHLNVMRTILTPPTSSADFAGQTVKHTLSCVTSSNRISNLEAGNISQQSLSFPVSLSASDKHATCAPISTKLATSSVSVPIPVSTIFRTLPTNVVCHKDKISVATMVTTSNISPKLHTSMVSCSPKQLNTGFGRGSLPMASNVASQALHLPLNTAISHQVPVTIGKNTPMEKQQHLLNLIPAVTHMHASTVSVMTTSSGAQQMSSSSSSATSSQYILKPSVIESGKQAPKPTFSFVVTTTSVAMQQTSSTVISTMSAEIQADVHTQDADLKQKTNSLPAMPQLKVMCNVCKNMLNGYEEITRHVCYKPDCNECEMCKYPLQSTTDVAVHVCTATNENTNKANRNEEGGSKVTLFPCVKCKQLFTGCTEFYKHTKDHYAYTQTTKTCTNVDGTPLGTTGEEKEIFKLILPNEVKVLPQATCSYIYSQCPKTFSEESSAVAHFENSHKSQAYSCTEVHCKDSFTSKEQLEFHYLTEHAFECLICSYKCRSHEQIESHVLEHCLQEVSLSFYECIECQQCLVTLQAFKDHCKAMHPNANPDVYREKNHVWYRCKPCIINFWSKSLLVDHIKYDHWKKLDYSCGVCKTMFNYAKLHKVLEHLQGHGSFRKINVNVDLQVCHSCLMVFPSQVTYSRHMLCSKHRKCRSSLIDSNESCNKTDTSKAKKCVTEISHTTANRCDASKAVKTKVLMIVKNETLGSEGNKTDVTSEKNIKTEALAIEHDDTDELKHMGEIDTDTERHEQVASFIIPGVKEEQDNKVINKGHVSGSDSFSNETEVCNGKTKCDKDNNDISDKDETVGKDKQPQITQRDLYEFSANIQQMTCPQCGLKFTSLFQLKQHKVMHHICPRIRPFTCNPKKRKMCYGVSDGKKSD